MRSIRTMVGVGLCCLLWGLNGAVGQELRTDGNGLTRISQPNFRQAEQYSSTYLRQFVYSTSVSPNWLEKTDEFWYSYKTSQGTQYWLVNPEKLTKLPLFDHVKLAAQLSEMTRQPVEPMQLDLNRLKVDRENDTLQFVVGRKLFEYSLKTELLKDAGDAPRETPTPTGRGRGRQQEQEENEEEGEDGKKPEQTQAEVDAHRAFSPDRKSYVFAKGHNLFFVKVPEQEPVQEAATEKPTESLEESTTEKTEEIKEEKKEGDQRPEANVGRPADSGIGGQATPALLSLLASASTQETQQEQKKDEQKQDEQKQDEQKQDEQKQDEQKQDEQKQDEQKQDEETKASDASESEDPKSELKAVDPKWDELAIQITEDGAEDYSFAGRRGRGGSRGRQSQATEITDETLTRPNVNWSEDSQSFFVMRSDTRGVQDLWVINSLADPRPTLETYGYPMPGEDKIRKSELHYFNVGFEKLKQVDRRWKDEFYSEIRFAGSGHALRFLRRDRLLRNLEYCQLTVETGETQTIFEEGFEKANLAPRGMRFLNDNKEMIWWSERSGWGHFYLYDADGKLKNPITSGMFYADSIVDVDEENRILYFKARGREAGENLNYEHLYSVRLDGGDLKLLDPGDANHSSRLSPSKKYLVDNYSRVDLPPVSVLRNSDGVEVMALESCDVSRLTEVGWKIPETFVVKAADGVTDLFGNMYKPFDFDPRKRYPIITYVYPGPQQEGTRHTFTATAGEQQLAQIGFIVIQVGHRGGTPERSKAYSSYGYFNLRDYALADKKAAIEQLAQRFPFIDVANVGIYGHSGGGFMTAAALMLPPYNDFFKAGFSTAGNHDNNIYNNSWSERWHGLQEVEVAAEETASRGRRGGERQGGVRPAAGPSDLRAVLDVQPDDFFYEYELGAEESPLAFERRMWGDDEPLPLWLQEQEQEQERMVENLEQTNEGRRGGQRGRRQRERRGQQQEEQQQQQQEKKDDDVKEDVKQEEQQKEKTDQDGEKENSKQDGQETKTDKTDKDGKEQDKDGTEDDGDKEKKKETKFEIRIPTNAELAENLKHHLFLVHGELDNNVHPANTLRVVDALIKANKKFDMLYLPATRHGFGSYQPYVTQRMFEFFAEKLIVNGDE